MKIIETKVYDFEELNDKAKEKARDWYREASSADDWYEYTIEDAKTVFQDLGYDITNVYFRGFSSQGDGACFEGSWDSKECFPEKLKANCTQDTELHWIADQFTKLLPSIKFASLRVKQKGHYSHEYCTDFTVSICDEEGNEIDTSEASDLEKELIKLSRDCMKWIYRQLEKEWDYFNADEQVDESIKSNEYTFTETGKRFG